MTIKAIFFDMDGVLIEAKDWHYEALNQALSLFGHKITRLEHLTSFDGLPTRKKLEMLSAERGLPTELHEFLNQLKQSYTHDIVLQKCRPFFAHERALSVLKRDGYNLAVCSNSVRSSVELMMDRSGLDKYLDLLVSNQDVTNSKPSPEMYIKAMDYFGRTPQECLILEDNENGIRAAREAGAHVMVVAEVDDVSLEAIREKIRVIEEGGNQWL